jgi:hypothetical protein
MKDLVYKQIVEAWDILDAATHVKEDNPNKQMQTTCSIQRCVKMCAEANGSHFYHIL